MNTKKFEINHYSWVDNTYQPKVEYHLSLVEEGFHMHIIVHECDPKREKIEHFQYVHEDSCVEWFVNFAPEICERYFNFEVNANGCMNVAFKKGRRDNIPLSVEDVESLNIKTNIETEQWEVEYTVPFSFLQKFIPGYQFREGMTIKANFYKCGDNTEYPHFGMWNKVEVEKPDFHRPEFFGEIVLD